MNGKNKIRQSMGSRLFDVLNYTFLILLMLITLYPFWYVIVASISDNSSLQAAEGIILLPVGKINFGAYKLAFEHSLLLSSYKNTLMLLAVSLPINIVMTLFCANFLAAKNLLFKRPLTLFMLFTMYFSGGMIPAYLNIKDLGLYNSMWALILPGALSLYNAIITKTAIEGIPDSLSESAYLDGAGELTVLFKIILPLLKPTIAVLVLYYGVGLWNSWFPASIYIKDNVKLPLQNILRSIMIENSSLAVQEGDVVANSFTETIKYAVVIISTLPILCVYPFLQKYFAKGVMIGAVKG